MTYAETIQYLFAKLPMFSKTGIDAIKPGLKNILLLCEALGNPHQKFKSIHIAGTNGKGSVSHMLAAVLQTSGYNTGLYTSPHLKDFKERIKVNGNEVEEAFIIDFVKKISPQIEAINPSFFEITVAMAFSYFGYKNVEIAVIETGLGGRLDSTNIITPILSIITNIGKDHEQILGNTLVKIATEKAGIIKENIPVIIGEQTAETRAVFEQIAEIKMSPIYFADEMFKVTYSKLQHDYLDIELKDLTNEDSYDFKLGLTGAYQLKNVLSVIAAVSILNKRGMGLEYNNTHKALANVKPLTGLHGRWDIVSHNPKVVLDVCHNVEGFKEMINQIKLEQYQSLHVILGMSRDKDIESAISLLPSKARYYCTQADAPRAMPADILLKMLTEFGLQSLMFGNVNEAIKAVKAIAANEDLIIVCGSVFVVGEVDSN